MSRFFDILLEAEDDEVQDQDFGEEINSDEESSEEEQNDEQEETPEENTEKESQNDESQEEQPSEDEEQPQEENQDQDFGEEVGGQDDNMMDDGNNEEEEEKKREEAQKKFNFYDNFNKLLDTISSFENEVGDLKYQLENSKVDDNVKDTLYFIIDEVNKTKSVIEEVNREYVNSLDSDKLSIIFNHVMTKLETLIKIFNRLNKTN